MTNFCWDGSASGCMWGRPERLTGCEAFDLQKLVCPWSRGSHVCFLTNGFHLIFHGVYLDLSISDGKDPVRGSRILHTCCFLQRAGQDASRPIHMVACTLSKSCVTPNSGLGKRPMVFRGTSDPLQRSQTTLQVLMLRQFGLRQYVPQPCNTNMALHGIDRHGGAAATDWANEQRHSMVTRMPKHGSMSYSDQYMVWCRGIMRRFITHPWSRESTCFSPSTPMIHKMVTIVMTNRSRFFM